MWWVQTNSICSLLEPTSVPPAQSHLLLLPALSRHLPLYLQEHREEDVQHSVICCCTLAPALRSLTWTLTGLSSPTELSPLAKSKQHVDWHRLWPHVYSSTSKAFNDIGRPLPEST